MFSQKIVKCDECAVLVFKEDAQKIPVERIPYFDEQIRYYTNYYCTDHYKRFARIVTGWGGTHYYQEFNVNQDGIPFGYEVKQEKKPEKVGRPSNKAEARKIAKRIYQREWYHRNKAKKALAK